MHYKRGTLAERLWPRVAWVGQCWEWQGGKTVKGYGSIWNGELGIVEGVHRAAWRLVFGDPGDRCVLHRCDNPPCCRPDHLFLGGRTSNTRDRDLKGRGRCGIGERQGLAKLTADIVRQIRVRHERGEALQALADEFDVAKQSVWLAVRRKTWKHVP